MIRRPKYWIKIMVFQIVFGMVVFAITRQYYTQDSDKNINDPTVVREPRMVWPERITENNPARISSSTFNKFISEDPVEISRQANEYFANKQYDKAANLYERLLAHGPNTAETYNNLGITLHYLGRSSEALSKLNKGVSVDPTNQRIRLTLGFVNSQLGKIEQARSALTAAVKMGVDNEVGQSAQKMLENLP